MGGIEKPTTGNPHNRGILKSDTKLLPILEGLREFVDTINQSPDLALRGGIYRGIEKADVQTVRVDGLEIGYKLEDHGVFMRRKVFVKAPGYRMEDIPHEEIEPAIVAVMDVFFVQGAGMPSLQQIAPDCMLVQQDVIPMLLVERNPNLVSIAGGFGEKKHA